MKLIIPFALLFVIYSCNNRTTLPEKKPCDSPSSISGIIVSAFSFGDCFSDYMVENKDYVITNDSQYKALKIQRSDNSSCANATYPVIDFTKYTLLGKYATGGGCSIGYARNVSRDDAAKTYTYTVHVKGCGECAMAGISNNWVLVPRLPDGYTVKFLVN